MKDQTMNYFSENNFIIIIFEFVVKNVFGIFEWQRILVYPKTALSRMYFFFTF